MHLFGGVFVKRPVVSKIVGRLFEFFRLNEFGRFFFAHFHQETVVLVFDVDGGGVGVQVGEFQTAFRLGLVPPLAAPRRVEVDPVDDQTFRLVVELDVIVSFFKHLHEFACGSVILVRRKDVHVGFRTGTTNERMNIVVRGLRVCEGRTIRLGAVVTANAVLLNDAVIKVEFKRN